MGFDELYGNEPVKKSLKKTLETGHVSNSYVFEGMAGVGKRLCADLFAQALVCEGEFPKDRPCGTCPACVKARSRNHLTLSVLSRRHKKRLLGWTMSGNRF